MSILSLANWLICIGSYKRESCAVKLAEREILLLEGLFHNGKSVEWAYEELKPMLVSPLPQSAGTPLFGSLLAAPLQSSNGRYLTGLQAGFDPARKEDWREWADALFSRGRWLSTAQKIVTSHRLPTVEIWMTLPYPRRTDNYFGKVRGEKLTFTNEADRISALQWWIQYAADGFKKYVHDKWGAGLTTPALRLRGMVWGREGISEHDKNVVIQTNRLLRSIGLESMWLPNFGTAYLSEWRELGFDRVSLFSNYTGRTEYGIDMLKNASHFALSQRTGLQVVCGKGVRFDDTHYANYVAQTKAYVSAGGSGPIVYRFPNHSLYSLYRDNIDLYRQVAESVTNSKGGGT